MYSIEIFLVIFLLREFGNLNAVLQEKLRTLERDDSVRDKTESCGHAILQIFAQLFSFLNQPRRGAQKGMGRSWCLGAKRIWIKPAANRALPYPTPLSHQKEMQVPHLGTRKKPRTVSRHPRHLRAERGRSGPSLSSFPFPFRICFPSRSVVFAKRSITICGCRFSIVCTKILYYPVAATCCGIFYSSSRGIIQNR